MIPNKYSFETYGKQPFYTRWYNSATIYKNVDYRASLGVYGLDIYRPAIKTYKKILGGTGITACLVTPGTNLMIPMIVRWMLR